jgi:hypothetical protein
MGLAMRNAMSGSSANDVARAAALHDAGKLYPRLTITSPHGGGAVRVELTLCDPETDETAIQMFVGEATEEGAPWAH